MAIQLIKNNLTSLHPSFIASKAFTLAEVLITLGIIGVVAALTLPTLIQNYKEKQTVTHLKKIYSTLSQAFNLIREEEGGVDLGRDTFNNSSLELINRFGKHMKFIKICENQTVSGCFDYSQPYNKINGEYYFTFNIEDFNGPRASGILADGTTIMFGMKSSSADGKYAQIYVDVNGSKAPNKIGEDFFYFFLQKDKLVPGGHQNYGKNTAACLPPNSGSHCTALVIFNGNMDYLHCPDKFKNENATSCKN